MELNRMKRLIFVQAQQETALQTRTGYKSCRYFSMWIKLKNKAYHSGIETFSVNISDIGFMSGVNLIKLS